MQRLVVLMLVLLPPSPPPLLIVSLLLQHHILHYDSLAIRCAPLIIYYQTNKKRFYSIFTFSFDRLNRWMDILSNYILQKWFKLSFVAPNISLKNNWLPMKNTNSKTLIAYQWRKLQLNIIAILSGRHEIFTNQINVSNYTKWTCWNWYKSIFVPLLALP